MSNIDINELVSERSIYTNKYDSIILGPTQEVFNDIHRFIEVFPHLISIDYAPRQFLQQLSDFFGYKFLETEDDEVQREILKRLVQTYHNKGLVSELHKIANRAHDRNFYLGDLTFYNHKINEGYSSITYSRDYLFRYDYSRWDGGHRWPDATEWREGVVQIDMSNPDPTDRVYRYIDENLAAGLKYYVTTLRDISGDIGYVDMVYRTLEDLYDQWVLQDLGLVLPYAHEESFRYDYSIWDVGKWDSHLVVSVDHWIEKKPQAGIHNVFYPDDFGYTVAEVYDEPFIYNWNRFCGIIGGTD